MLPHALGLLLLAQLGLTVPSRPNILFVLTDDQDWHMESVEHMKHLKDLIVSKGTTYNQHYCTVALCCPSRATLWTGLAAHNHNVTNVSPPHGGYPKVVSQGINDDNLFVWMQEAGYNTYYAGKLWNFHTVDNYNKPYAKGFNGSDFLLDPFTYQYWNAKISHNGGEPVSYAGQYSTDVLVEKSLTWLDAALKEDSPFFATIAPIAPHSDWVIDVDKDLSYLQAPKSAPRHQHLFDDYIIPRGASYNQVIEGGAGWVGQLPPLNSTTLSYNDHYQRQRLRALQAVDEMLLQLVDKLKAAGELENTYIFYTTDNGYHISQHRMHPGKECGYDTDIHIPFFVRGPDIAPGGVFDMVTTHTDVAATVLQIAGISKEHDGTAIPLRSLHRDIARHEHASVEYWGYGVPEGIYGGKSDRHREAGQWDHYYPNNTFKGLRIVSDEYSLYYSVWCTNETEFFDLHTDPAQVQNLLSSDMGPSGYQIATRPLEQIQHRLNTLVMVLKTCVGRTCTHPWEKLHPDGNVRNLKQALSSRFDDFYREQPVMWFNDCPSGYFAEVENQDPVEAFTGAGGLQVQRLGFNWENHWQHFT